MSLDMTKPLDLKPKQHVVDSVDAAYQNPTCVAVLNTTHFPDQAAFLDLLLVCADQGGMSLYSQKLVKEIVDLYRVVEEGAE